MQLNEILEENTLKAISQKTNISEENLEAIISGEFSALKKVKTMGFISIIEREYHADLSSLKKEAQAYYEAHSEDVGIVLDTPTAEPQKGKSKLLILTVIVLIALASWYVATQFNQEKLQGLLPFSEEKAMMHIGSDDATGLHEESNQEMKLINDGQSNY